MAVITIARALTKLKTIEARIQKEIQKIGEYSGIHSKTVSPLSNSKDLVQNQREAAAELAKSVQRIEDLMNWYRKVKVAIADSNRKTIISTGSDKFGDITVADALVLCQNVRGLISTYSMALSAANAKAVKVADFYNTKNLSSQLASGLTADELLKLQAQPILLVDGKLMDKMADLNLFLATTLNPMINESNALTSIEIDGDLPDDGI